MRECTKPLVLMFNDFAMREHTAAQADDLDWRLSDRVVNGKPVISASNRSPKDWFKPVPQPRRRGIVSADMKNCP